MTVNEYQKQALTTDYNPQDTENIDITDKRFMSKVLGLVGESGEFADKVKKLYRDKDGAMDNADRERLLTELGDVLWYVGVTAHYLGADLEEVASMNLKKLADRASRNAIQGEGDNR